MAALSQPIQIELVDADAEQVPVRDSEMCLQHQLGAFFRDLKVCRYIYVLFVA